MMSSAERIFICISLILSFVLCTAAFAESEEDYRIATGDVLGISIFGEPDLSVDEVRVATTGVISFPLLGEVKVLGRTAKEIESQLTTLLLDGYLKHPKVTVFIKEYRLFFVHGAVESPGGYNYQDGLTVEKAVVLAGGFTERASKEKITLVSESNSEESVKVKLNHTVRPGDIITVGESFF